MPININSTCLLPFFATTLRQSQQEKRLEASLKEFLVNKFSKVPIFARIIYTEVIFEFLFRAVNEIEGTYLKLSEEGEGIVKFCTESGYMMGYQDEIITYTDISTLIKSLCKCEVKSGYIVEMLWAQ
jgi:hypothetical protein